jgi:uncharacterized protein (DUF433 family)
MFIGKPYIKGTRITAYVLLQKVAAGETQPPLPRL